MEIEINRVYEHDKHGEILVLGVHEIYTSYDTDTEDGTEDGVYVRYTTQWDGYGPIVASVQNEPINEFTAGIVAVGDRVTFSSP